MGAGTALIVPARLAPSFWTDCTHNLFYHVAYTNTYFTQCPTLLLLSGPDASSPIPPVLFFTIASAGVHSVKSEVQCTCLGR